MVLIANVRERQHSAKIGKTRNIEEVSIGILEGPAISNRLQLQRFFLSLSSVQIEDIAK